MPDAPAASADVPEPDIRQLLREPDRLTLVVQPIVALHRAEVVGYEALSRFRLERPIGPDRVFMAAARQGVAAELEAMVIERGFGLADRLPDNCFLFPVAERRPRAADHELRAGHHRGARRDHRVGVRAHRAQCHRAPGRGDRGGELAGRLDAWLLAEGIETPAELRVLRQLGVPLGQGYFLARPGTP